MTPYCIVNEATPTGIPVSGQGFPQGRMPAGGFCHYAIVHIDNSHSKPQSTNHRFHLTTVGACATHDNGQISAFPMWAVDQKPDYYLEWPNAHIFFVLVIIVPPDLQY